MNAPVMILALLTQAVPLWPGVAPGTSSNPPKEQTYRNTPIGTVIVDVTKPTLTPFLPVDNKAMHPAVIVAPGGACIALTMGLDGYDVASWLQRHGIAAFVLKYRLMHKTGSGIPKDLNEDIACRNGTADAIQAVKIVREHSAQWRIDPHRVGVLGFSAGGMVVSGALVNADASLRPNFAGLIYGAPFGVLPPVPHRLPPVFMAWAKDDRVAAEAMRRFYGALRAGGDTVEAHVYASGGHAFGLKRQHLPSDAWIDQYYDWLRSVAK